MIGIQPSSLLLLLAKQRAQKHFLVGCSNSWPKSIWASARGRDGATVWGDSVVAVFWGTAATVAGVLDVSYSPPRLIC